MPQTKFNPQGILKFFKLAEKLKTILRHSWTSNSNRQESVAEHTWMMALMAIILMPYMKRGLNQEKVLKMIILHDLAEALTEDLPVWEGVDSKEDKMKAERAAINKMLAPLESNIQNELLEIWEEYERRETFEARFVKAIDTLDVVAQHNTADISTWDDNDYFWQLSPLQDSFFDIDANLRKLKDELDKWSIDKVEKEGSPSKLDQDEYNKRKQVL